MRLVVAVPILIAIAVHAARAQPLDARIDKYLKQRSAAAFSGVITVARN